MSRWILFVVIADEFHKLLHSPFLEDPHQRGSHGLLLAYEARDGNLHFVGGDFGYSAITVDVTPCDLLEFEVTRDIRVLCSGPMRAVAVPQGCLSILRWP